MKKYYKFNRETMQFEKSHEKRNLTLLVCIAFAALLTVQCVKIDTDDTIHPKQDKMQQNAQIELDTTLQHYNNSAAFRAIVKAAEIRYNKYQADSTIKSNFK